MKELPDYRTHKHTLYGVQEGVCAGCRVHFPFRNLTIDHVVPRAKGGQDNPENSSSYAERATRRRGPDHKRHSWPRYRRKGSDEEADGRTCGAGGARGM